MKRIVTIFLLLSCLYLPAFSQDATEIMRRSDAHLRGESTTAEITMTIVRHSWTRSVSMKSWSRGTDFSMILITNPARDKGTAFLKRQNEIWNWVPSIGRSVKMPPSMMMQSWMGSDFTNDDLVRESSAVNDYDHSLVRSETLNGADVFVIDMTPKQDAAVVWGRVRTFITKNHYNQMRTEFYDEFDELVSVMTASDLKTFDGRVLPSRMEITPVDKPGQSTILVYESLKYNVNNPESFFSVQNMRRLK
jgi:hypothetical protein